MPVGFFTYLLHAEIKRKRGGYYVRTQTTFGNIYPTGLVAKAKEMDLLTYLKKCEPQELVHLSRRIYTTRTHDSLKISNGMWMWWSHGIGGKTALEYLIQVRGLPFIDAVQTILQHTPGVLQSNKSETVPKKERLFVLPRAAPTNEIVIDYLTDRSIAKEVIGYCIENKLLYESYRHHDVVFVGYDQSGAARYAGLRSTSGRSFKGDAEDSEKAFSFRFVNQTVKDVHVFEGAIDLLSYATMMQMENKDWRCTNLLSLAGVSVRKRGTHEAKLPAALAQFLHDNPQIQTIHLHLDRDAAGRIAAETLTALLSDRYTVIDEPPEHKDVNEDLCRQLQLPKQINVEGRKNR